MIELLIIVGLAVLSWLAWKGKLKPLIKMLDNNHASPSQQVTSSTAVTDSQTNAPGTTPTPMPEPIAEPAPQASIATSVVEEPVAPLTVESTAINPPEDSVLKRHYLTGLQAEKDAISNPYPTDSVLRRHHETLDKIATARQESSAKADLPEDSIVQTLDQDQLRSEIEAELPAPPTDSVLKRHYDSLLQAKLQEGLSAQ
ncbi:RodZ family helix-turn-helix domain-containing protein [Methylomonas albis]|uniref:Uncharacterized protein n=1 Tax=Methylomonas albis TaxID=1854563 RepID=A0ABR9CX06_9GAMM|nr:hypothetical protein [Methylomonas albis]MBD9355260.1 hypothetical protein [Methylomonas albis]